MIDDVARSALNGMAAAWGRHLSVAVLKELSDKAAWGLCLHDIYAIGEKPVTRAYSCSEASFERIIDYLSRSGIERWSIPTLASRPLAPATGFICTVDDGIKRACVTAAEVTARYGVPLVLNLVTGWLSNGTPWQGLSTLTFEDVRAIADQYPHVMFGSHGQHHLRGEAANPERALEDLLSILPTNRIAATFAPPFGSTSPPIGPSNQTLLLGWGRVGKQGIVRRLPIYDGLTPSGLRFFASSAGQSLYHLRHSLPRWKD